MEKKQRTILIVDDIELNRSILNEIFCQDYMILEACNGKEALEIIAKTKIDIMLLDIVMPVLDGFGVLEYLQQQGLLEYLPVIMITAETSEAAMKRGYNLGVTDIITKPFNPDIVRRRVKNVLSLYSRQENLEELVAHQTKALQNQTRELIDALSTIIEFKNTESGQHVLKIRLITKFLLQRFVKKHSEYIVSPRQIDMISQAASMHDIGKIAISDDILNKPTRLSNEEYEIMKAHTIKGYEIAKKLKYLRNHKFMDYCLDICRHHHERWDGNGYPDRLKGNEISIWSQIVALADVYDALTSERVYKNAFSHKKAISMIVNKECGTFNPELISCFLENEESMFNFLKDISNDDLQASEYDYDFYDEDVLIQRVSDRTLKLLELEREKFRIMSEISGDIIFDYNIKKDILTFSDKFNSVFNKNNIIENASLWLKSSRFIFKEDKDKLFVKLKHTSFKNKIHKLQVRLQMPKKNYEWYEIYIHSIWDNENQEFYTIIGKLVNINKQYIELEKWKRFANTDPLTCVYNCKGLSEQISKVLLTETSQKSALLYIDINNLKKANDTFGHLYGDELLVQITNQLKTNIRYSDIIGRISGDEFIILLRDIKNLQSVSNKAKQLCNVVGKKFKGNDYSINIGIAIFPTSATTYEELIDKADKALYKSKKMGEGQYTIDS